MERFLTSFKYICAIVVCYVLTFAVSVQAQCVPGEVGNNCEGQLQNPLRFKSLADFLLGVVDIFINIGAIIGVMGILYAGFMFVTAQGNETKLSKAKSAFLWSIIGLGVIVGAFVITAAIQGTIDGLRP